MTLEELYKSLEGLENGAELINGIKGAISQINEKAKSDRLKFESQINDLTTLRDELQGKINDYESSKGEKSADMLALEKQFKALNDKYEKAEADRLAEIEKRTHSEISAQTIAALTKANAIDPQAVYKLVADQIKVQEDGSYGYTKEDGTIGTIEECANAWIADKPYLVKNTQHPGSNAAAGHPGGNTQLAEMFKMAGVEPPKSDV